VAGVARCGVVVSVKYTPRLAAYYRDMWEGLTVSIAKRKEAASFARKILVNKARYQRIEKATGVPWHFVALTHYRESTLNFNKNLCNGQPLNMRTTIVPKGRGPYRDFEESAYDALVTIKGYSSKLDWSVSPYIYRIEGYNGYGYHGKGIPSPYLVGGSNKHKRGKYIRDHVYDPNHMDTQLGVLTLLKALMELDPSIKFGAPSKPKPIPPPPDIDPAPDHEPTDQPKGWFRSWGSRIKAILVGGGFTSLGFLTDWQIAAAFFAFLLILVGVSIAVFFWIFDAEDVRDWLKKQVQ
jgi:lysozyme family protein